MEPEIITLKELDSGRQGSPFSLTLNWGKWETKSGAHHWEWKIQINLRKLKKGSRHTQKEPHSAPSLMSLMQVTQQRRVSWKLPPRHELRCMVGSSCVSQPLPEDLSYQRKSLQQAARWVWGFLHADREDHR